MNTVLIASFNEAGPAEILKERLAQAGHPAVVNNESKLERFGFLSTPRAAFHVEVRREDFLPARQCVEKWDREEGILSRAVRCPECRSARVEYPQATRKFVTPALVGLLLAMRLVPREFYCVDCQFTWPEKKREEPERDILGWPTRSKFWHPEAVKSSADRKE
jgi:hypothetical protein